MFPKETSYAITATTIDEVVNQVQGGGGHTHLFFPVPYPGEGTMVPLDADVKAYPKLVPLTVTSKDEGHTHQVLGVVQITPIMTQAPSTTQPGQMEDMLGGFREEMQGYQLDDAPGHTHLPGGEIPLDDNADKAGSDADRDDETFRNAFTLRKLAIEWNAEAYKEAGRAEEFVHGEQWPPKPRGDAYPADDDRTPELTFNHTQAIFNVLSGIIRNNRTDPQFFPVEGGDERVANILDLVEKDMLAQNNFAVEDALAFEDQEGPGLGVVHVTSELSPELTEDVIIRRIDWKRVHLGPHEHISTEDMLHAHIDELLTKRDLELLYPDFKDKIGEMFTAGAMVNTGGAADTAGEIYITHTRVPVEMMHEMTGSPVAGKKPKNEDLAVIDFTARTIKHITTYIREKRAVPVAIGAGGEPVNLEGVGAKNLRRLRSIADFALIDVPQKRVKRICWAGALVLRDDVSQLTGPEIPLSVYYGRKFRKKFYGKVQPLMDIQRFYNKFGSLLTDALTRAAHMNEVFDGETFENDDDIQTYRQSKAKSNCLLKVANVDRPPKPTMDGKFPFDLMQGKQDLLSEMRMIANVNPEMLGLSAFSRETGQASGDRTTQALQGNEYLFDHHKFANRRLYKLLVHSIQYIYKDNPQGMLRILGTYALREEVNVGGQKFGPGAPISDEAMAALEQLLKTTDLLKHDVVCEESSQSPTVRMRTSSMIFDLVNSGKLPMLPEFIDLLPLPRDLKDKMKQGIQANQQAQAQAAQLPYQTEILKTQIKKGGAPQGQ